MLAYLITLLMFVTVAYYIGQHNKTEETTTLQNNEEFECPYLMEGGMFTDVNRASNEVKIVDKPLLVIEPEAVILNKIFNEQEFENELDNPYADKPWGTREFDVDDDGEDELIINANIAMNHTPHIATIVDNGNIIFDRGGVNIWIEEVHGNQGFLLLETLDWNTGEAMKTRYINKDSGFMPVWTQKVCWVKFE